MFSARSSGPPARKDGGLNPVPALFDHKLLMRSMLLQHGFRQAETVAVLARGAIQLRPFSPAQRWASAEQTERWLLEDGGRFIVKPESSGRGLGIALVEAVGGVLVRKRGSDATPFRVPSTGVKLIERELRQHEFWEQLHPASANTIRVLTVWTPGEAAPVVAAAVQRIGTAATAPTDNWSAGGICAAVDLESGRLGPGRMHPRKGRNAQPSYSRHPETGAQIEGALLPHWNAVRDTVLRACAISPLICYAGWDVLVDRDGIPVIIEANNNSDVNLLQVHGGLLRRAEVKRFYQRCGAL